MPEGAVDTRYEADHIHSSVAAHVRPKAKRKTWH